MKDQTSEYYPVALTIAGSDSGGGAGIQADLRTMSAIGVYGCSAITAVTSQNPRRVARIDVLPPEAVTAQLDAVFECFAVRGVKTGMLADAAIVRAVADSRRRRWRDIPLVIDPVMVSTSGAQLLTDDAVEALKTELLGLADWLTPNIPEAELLLGRKLGGFAARAEAAAEIAERWRVSCLLKGGHAIDADSTEAVDIVAHDGKLYTLSSPAAEERGASHGTSCTLSAAMAALLAGGTAWKAMLREARGFVYGSLEEPAPVGPDCMAMYPPLENYAAQVSLKRLENA